MKSLNESNELWSNLSIKEVEDSAYMAACCLNIQVNRIQDDDLDRQDRPRTSSEDALSC